MSDSNYGGPSAPAGPENGTGTMMAEQAPPTQTQATPPPPAQPPGTAVGTGEAPRPIPDRTRRGGVTVGIILIVLGGLMLLGRYAPWGSIWRLWPLVIVIGGIAEMVRPRGDAPIKRIAEGLGTVVVGGVLLLNSFGVVAWSVWLNMLALWPMLIVGLGVELVGRGLKLDWVRALSNVLLTLTLLYGVFVLGPAWHGGVFWFAPTSGQAATFDQTAPHDPSATTGSASIYVGATRLTVGAGDSLIRMKGRTAKGAEPQLSHGVVSGQADVSIQDPQDGVVILPYPDRSLDVTLDRAVTWDSIMLQMGAADANVDLRELKVKKIDASVGASSVTLRVGSKADNVKVNVSGGATSVVVHVPANAEVDVDAQSGLSAVSVPDTFKHVSGIAVIGDSRWTKSGSGGPTITISLQSGVSSLEIITD